jgi:hypothetical protein
MALSPINQRETTMAFRLKSRTPNDGDQDLSASADLCVENMQIGRLANVHFGEYI